jgi:ABC-type transport system involved in multi-copper enzyme maturation permease subunit
LAAFGFSLYCVLLCVFALDDPNRFFWGILVNAFQVPVGLLLVSISSVTSLQDERVRDSLDVLLTTPLSTAQIYWGKWWGSYRIVFFLAALPTFVAAGPLLRQCWQQGGWPTAAHPMDWYFLLMPLVVCCYGSAVVTTGLALAIWIKRAGRAMASSVVIFIFLTVGLLFAPLVQNGPDRTVDMGSSFLASGYLTEVCLRPYRRQGPTVPVLMLWCIFYTLVSAIVSLAACRSFDRCLGRMPDKMPRRFLPERAVRRIRRRARTSEPAT